MMAQPSDRVCLWCRKEFTPRRDGGKRQLFCRPVCRRDFDAAGRRWVAEAIATGVLTVDALKISPVATRALVPASISPALVAGDAAPPWHPAPVAPRAESDHARQTAFEQLLARTIAARRR
jgi:hypothetical protein